MIIPYPYQKKIIDQKPTLLKAALTLGCGTGKTFISLSIAEGNTLVLTNKTIRDDQVWEYELNKMGGYGATSITFLKVLSKEDFKRDYKILPKFDTVIIDEHHLFCGLTPNTRWRNKFEIPKASQIFEACQEYIKKTNPKRLYLCSATPLKNPMTVLAAALLLGKSWDFLNWRHEFYVKLKMPGRIQAFVSKKDIETKNKLAKIVQSLGPTGRLSDFTDVPLQSHIVKHIPLTTGQIEAIKELPMLYPDPIVLLGKTHQIEQGILSGTEFEDAQVFETGKIDAILSLCEQYDKVLVFAKYTAQISLISSLLKKNDIPVYTLTGATKDRGNVIRDAETSTRCVVVCQSQISSGFELPSFRCTIFASESWSFVDFEQSVGRTLRMNKLAPNLYVYLISGAIDKAVREALINKKDFSDRIFLNL